MTAELFPPAAMASADLPVRIHSIPFWVVIQTSPASSNIRECPYPASVDTKRPPFGWFTDLSAFEDFNSDVAIPNWPKLLFPQTNNRPERVTKIVCSSPHAASWIASSSAIVNPSLPSRDDDWFDESFIARGTVNSAGYSLPQHECLFSPQTNAVPWAVMTTACPSPAATPTSGNPTRVGNCFGMPHSDSSRWPAISGFPHASNDMCVVKTSV